MRIVICFSLILWSITSLSAVSETTSTPGSTSEPRVFPHPDRIHYDSQCLTIDGKDVMIFSGAFHYFRCPKELWHDRFQKIKDAGLNCVETVVPWNCHEREMPTGLDDFSKVDMKDLDDWMTMAEQFGLYIIIRPGPYTCAEWDTGGFPQWLLLKQPENPLRGKLWLRTDDPVFLAWCKHWFDAVCPVIAKHQITKKAPGQKGVILFQIENEYVYSRQSSEIKINCLTALANDAHADGIEVPLFTCLTHEIREAHSGPLRSVFDCENFYPKRNIKSKMEGKLADLRTEQPDAPLGVSELQGGWFADVGQKLSDQDPTMTAAQIQNLTLYAWQSGVTLSNYYMLFGGTNFDDRGARYLITSYDYAAPIRENGGVGDRYQRVWALGHMLQDHGAKLVRATTSDIDWSASDKDVGIAERRAKDGSRYIFVRNDNFTKPENGHAQVKEKNGSAPDLDFDYQLEPFGSLVLYLPPGANAADKGEWLPKPAPEIERPTISQGPISITQVQMVPDSIPAAWQSAQPGARLATYGMGIGNHFVYYKIPVSPTAGPLTFKIPGGDRLLVCDNGTPISLGMTKETGPLTFTPSGQADHVTVLYENSGHGNGGWTMDQSDGILSIEGALNGALIESSGTESRERKLGEDLSSPDKKEDGLKWQSVEIGSNAIADPHALLTWYRGQFQLPKPDTGIWVPWHLHLEAHGDGFIYVNGHALGRYWEVGPQHDFYLPESWLNFNPGQTNVVAIDLSPLSQSAGIQNLSVAPDINYAELRSTTSQ